MKKTSFSQVSIAVGCILSDSTKILTLLEHDIKPSKQDIERLKTSIGDFESILELYKKNPLND